METLLPYQWQYRSAGELPPASRGSSLVFDVQRQQVVFVGSGGTWLWDGSVWHKPRVQGGPALRNTTHLTYDVVSGCVLLYGGVGMDGTPLNDIWLWNGAMWTEQHPVHVPFPVAGAALACHEASRQVVLFGGISGFDGVSGSNRVGTFSGQTWIWNGATWMELEASGTPPGRTGGQLVYDALRRQTILLGGIGASGYMNDMWVWSGTGWQQLHPAVLPPAQARYRAVFHEQLQRVVLLGESVDAANPLQRLYVVWMWDGVAWSQYPTGAVLPGSIEGFAYDGARNTIITCVVAGGKSPLPGKGAGAGLRLPELATPSLASQTWIWG